MAKAREEIKKFYDKVTQPIGENKARDEADLAQFLKVVDWLTKIGWFIMGIIATISFYFFITREIL